MKRTNIEVGKVYAVKSRYRVQPMLVLDTGRFSLERSYNAWDRTARPGKGNGILAVDLRGRTEDWDIEAALAEYAAAPVVQSEPGSYNRNQGCAAMGGYVEPGRVLMTWDEHVAQDKADRAEHAKRARLEAERREANQTKEGAMRARLERADGLGYVSLGFGDGKASMSLDTLADLLDRAGL